MHRILISKGLQCCREDVRKMVCDKDPEGVQLRKRSVSAVENIHLQVLTLFGILMVMTN